MRIKEEKLQRDQKKLYKDGFEELKLKGFVANMR